jgi:hypothetical protein
LFLKDRELLFEIGELGAKCGDFFFKSREALGFLSVDWRFGRGGVIGRCGRNDRFVDVAGKKVGEAGLFGTGLARKNFYERRFAAHEEIEGRVDGGEIVELVEAVGAGAELAGRLRTAEKQDAEESDLVAMKIVDVLKAVLELGDAAVGGGGAGEAVLIQRRESLADSVFVEGHDRVAIGFLVAGVEDGVEGQRVVFGSGDFFFDQGTEDASLGGSQVNVHGIDDTCKRDSRENRLSLIIGGDVRSWRNWQTHQLEVLAVVIPWRFESSRPHHPDKVGRRFLPRRVICFGDKRKTPEKSCLEGRVLERNKSHTRLGVGPEACANPKGAHLRRWPLQGGARVFWPARERVVWSRGPTAPASEWRAQRWIEVRSIAAWRA